jgi:hypothetical protein
MALKGFENAIRAKNDHAFAYYFAAKCYLKLGLDEKYEDCKLKYEDIISKSMFWSRYAIQFGLNALE